MAYRIMMRLRSNGNIYYFSRIDKTRNKPIGVMRYRYLRSALFPSVAAAAAVVKQIDPVYCRCVICKNIDTEDEDAMRFRILDMESKVRNHLLNSW